MKDFLSFFYFYLHIYIFFFLSDCCKTLSATLNRHAKSCYSFFVLDFRGNAFWLSHCNVCDRFVCTALIILSYVFFLVPFRHFFSYWDHHVISVLKSIYVWYYIYCFVYTESTLHHWHETSLVTVYNLLNVFLNTFWNLKSNFIENFYV